MSGRRAVPVRVLVDTVRALVDNRVLPMSAALAYYSALSLAPLVIITLGVTGMIVDRTVVEEQLVAQLRGLLGEQGADLLRTLASEQRLDDAGQWATIAGAAMLLLGASAVFVHLQDGLNVIWGVRPGPRRGLLRYLRTRLISMALVGCLGALLLASLLVNTFLSAMGAGLDDLLAPGFSVAPIVRFGSSFGITAALFALLFKWLPEADVAWWQAWSGALLTAALFHAGAWAIGQYIGRAAVGSAYGAAGSLVILLVWVYYAAFGMFTGAQFAAVLAEHATPGTR